MPRPLPQVELRYDGTWHTVTEDVYAGEQITTQRGRANWAALADPSEMTIPFRQHESAYATAAGGVPMVGRYAPRNPASDLFGKIGRNTPIRLRLGAARVRLRIPGNGKAAATTPDTAALRLTGDQRVEFLVKPRTWRPVDGHGLGRRYLPAGNQRAWAVWINNTGTISYRPSQDGSIFTTRESSVAVPDDGAERWIAIWHDVNNGAGGNTVGWETSPDGITWTALGANSVQAGTFAYFAAQAPLELGRVWDPVNSGIAEPSLDGELGAFRYRSGILASSTAVVDVDFRTMDTDVRTFVAQSRTWTLTEAAYMTDSSIRFAGEASAWPQTWDASGKVRSSPATVSGVLRRAQKTLSPLQSSLRRDLSTKANVVRYFPLEERTGAVRFGSGIAGDTSSLAANVPAEVKAAANGDMFIASDPLPTFGDGELAGNVPAYTPNVSQRLIWLVGVPSGGMPSDRHLMRVYTAGTAARWEVVYVAGNNLELRCYDDEGAAIFTHGPIAGDLDGSPQMLSLWLEQQGANLFFQLAYFPVGAGTAFVSDEGTLPSRTYTRITRLQLGTTVGLEGTVMGHVAILNGDVHNVWDTVGSSLIAWAGEMGTDRLLRLGADEGFPVRITEAGDTPAMGPQRSRTFVDLAREVPATDLGAFGDAGDDAGSLTYRPKRSMMRPPVLTIPYPLLVPPPLPVDDDQGTVNRVTVKNVNGVEFTAEDTTSTMSTLPPPAGVGLYDQSVDINAHTVAAAEGNAWWRLALGTVDASRWPELTFVLDKPELEPYVEAILAVKAGDIIRVIELPAGVPPGPVDLIVDAIADKITRALHTVIFTCGPGNIWGATNTWAAATGAPAGVARWSPADTYRSGGTVTTTQTGITLQNSDGRPWTTNAADFPFDIMMGGERMTVTNIGAGTSSQLFTVIRSVNGIVKTHPTGTRVQLAEPFVWSL